MEENLLPFEFVGSAVRTGLDLQVYRLAAIKKTAYRLAAQVTVALGEVSDGKVAATLLFKEGTTREKAMEVVRLFFQELVDQELREHIAEETAPLRALILANAFSKADLIRQK